jgi:3-hydroxyacyl-CoA dehydrogenase
MMYLMTYLMIDRFREPCDNIKVNAWNAVAPQGNGAAGKPSGKRRKQTALNLTYREKQVYSTQNIKNISGVVHESTVAKVSVRVGKAHVSINVSSEEAVEADLAIGAIFERVNVKQGIFRNLDANCLPQALLASNTSTIPITELACLTKRSTQILGHASFFQSGAHDAGG